MTLVDVVQHALAAFRVSDFIDWHLARFDWDRDTAAVCLDVARELADDVVRLCQGGHYRIAACVATREEYISAEYWDMIIGLGECPAWTDFREAVELAERIDSVLATLERSGEVREVARDCRADVSLLNVLADCCEDHGLPHAATETRHLARLVRAYLR